MAVTSSLTSVKSPVPEEAHEPLEPLEEPRSAPLLISFPACLRTPFRHPPKLKQARIRANELYTVMHYLPQSLPIQMSYLPPFT